MKIILGFFALLLISAATAQGAEPVAKQFLRYIYGADGIEFADVCHPMDDAWMLRGAKNANALAAIDNLKISDRPTGIASGVVGTDIYFIETRDGKVDPAFNLEGVYGIHRQLILRFIYSALSKNDAILGRLVTDASKVKVVGPKAGPEEMEQYGSIIGSMPVVRSSKPVEDAKTRTVSYRVPIGEEALMLTVLKDGSVWKIDTSKPVSVPLEFFFR